MNPHAFDYWKDLFKSDPKEFARQCDTVIRMHVDSLQSSDDDKNRILLKVQHQNAILDNITNKTQRLNQLQTMFWQQVDLFQRAINMDLRPQTPGTVIKLPIRQRHEKTSTQTEENTKPSV